MNSRYAAITALNTGDFSFFNILCFFFSMAAPLSQHYRRVLLIEFEMLRGLSTNMRIFTLLGLVVCAQHR